MEPHDDSARRRKTDQKSSQQVKPAKKVYRTPQLSIYGDIREITRNVGGIGLGDGSGMLMLKTQ